jgi:hypothetical protein
MPMTWTQEEIDTLRAAIASGILIVEYDGPPRRKVQYQTLSEMRVALSKMVSDNASASGRASYTLIATRKGL